VPACFLLSFTPRALTEQLLRVLGDFRWATGTDLSVFLFVAICSCCARCGCLLMVHAARSHRWPRGSSPRLHSPLEIGASCPGLLLVAYGPADWHSRSAGGRHGLWWRGGPDRRRLLTPGTWDLITGAFRSAPMAGSCGS